MGSSEQAERYLQSVLELAEDGQFATQVKITERLRKHRSTTDEATRRLRRAGLIRVEPGPTVRLTMAGATRALATVRKHRVIECFLEQIVGLDWALIHCEAVQWQHVVTDAVVARIVRILDTPLITPYGYAVPEAGAVIGDSDLDSLGASPDSSPLHEFTDPGYDGFVAVAVCRIAEHLQSDRALLTRLDAAGIRPGAAAEVARAARGGVAIRGAAGQGITVDRTAATGIRARMATAGVCRRGRSSPQPVRTR